MAGRQEPVRPLHPVRVAALTDPPRGGAGGVDPRVSMVLEVLAGRPAETVAHEWDVDVSLVQRWVRDFVVAGTAVVTHRPDPEEARQRERFLAAFAHELRTPVAVARGWAMMLTEGDVPEDEVVDSVARLAEGLNRLSEHILDVELAASASLGRVDVRPEMVDVESLAAELDGAPGVRRGAGLRVHADPRLLRRILRDLWTIAHQEPVPEHVEIEVVEAGSWHELRVVRRGTPIPPEVVTALFDPFDHNDDATGVTIGLYIARALTVAHGGFLGAEGDDESTVLLARLPREPSTAPVPAGPGPVADEGGTP